MKKKKREKVELDISNLLDEICYLLDYEIYINEKIEKGLPLTNNERFFHDYMISPSLLVRFLLKL